MKFEIVRLKDSQFIFRAMTPCISVEGK